MKRILFAILVVCVLLPIAAMAEEPFSLRNGYTWGMTIQEAMDLAKQEGLISDYHSDYVGIQSMRYVNVPLGEYIADLQLTFQNLPRGGTGLKTFQYNFQNVPIDSSDMTQLLEFLHTNVVSVYGEPESETPDDIHILAHWILPETHIVIKVYGEKFADEGRIHVSLLYEDIRFTDYATTPAEEGKIKNDGF